MHESFSSHVRSFPLSNALKMRVSSMSSQSLASYSTFFRCDWFFGSMLFVDKTDPFSSVCSAFSSVDPLQASPFSLCDFIFPGLTFLKKGAPGACSYFCGLLLMYIFLWMRVSRLFLSPKCVPSFLRINSDSFLLWMNGDEVFYFAPSDEPKLSDFSLLL
jgi:hypothetical protein